MALDAVRKTFEKEGIANRIIELDKSSATVADAAKALHTEEAHIAKSMSFLVDDQVNIIVMAGDVKIDNHKYKEYFHKKAKMVPFNEVEQLTSHPAGGVCSFALPSNVNVYLDRSLKRFKTVFPACGSRNSAIELNISELEHYSSNVQDWVDVTKLA